MREREREEAEAEEKEEKGGTTIGEKESRAGNFIHLLNSSRAPACERERERESSDAAVTIIREEGGEEGTSENWPRDSPPHCTALQRTFLRAAVNFCAK